MQPETKAVSLWTLPYLPITHFEPAQKTTGDLIDFGHQKINCGQNWKLKKLDELVSLNIPTYDLIKSLNLDFQKQYIAVIVNLKLIFNIQLENVYSLLKLDFLAKLTDQLVLETLVSYTRRRYFHKQFPKHNLIPKKNQKLYEEYFYFVIEHDPVQPDYFQIKIFNEHLYCCEIESNLSLATIQNNISTCFFNNYKKQKTIYCLFNGSSHTAIQAGIINFFIKHYNKIMFAHWVKPENAVELPRTFGRALLQHNVKLYTDISPERYVLATAPFSQENITLLQQISQRYNTINGKIFEEPINPELKQNIFFFNLFCTRIYGPFYNYLRNLKSPDYGGNKHLQFAKKIFEQLENIQHDRPIGHYAVKIKEKGVEEDGANKPRQISLLCCVCTKNNSDWKNKTAQEKKEMEQQYLDNQQAKNSRKSRHQCEKCSILYMKSIAICLPHFREFHKNIQDYIPKGVSKGADNYALMKISQNKTSEEDKGPRVFYDIETEANNILQSLRANVNAQMPLIEGFKSYVHQAHSQNQPFYPPFPQTFMFPSPLIFPNNQPKDISIKRKVGGAASEVKHEKIEQQHGQPMPILKKQQDMPNPNEQQEILELNKEDRDDCKEQILGVIEQENDNPQIDQQENGGADKFGA